MVNYFRVVKKSHRHTDTCMTACAANTDNEWDFCATDSTTTDNYTVVLPIAELPPIRPRKLRLSIEPTREDFNEVKKLMPFVSSQGRIAAHLRRLHQRRY